MKRLLSLALAAVMLAASLASCAVSPGEKSAISANIRITSSDAESAAEWLTERLGERLTDRVVLGTNSDGYGVDLSALESDGYFIRACGSEDVLLAKTTSGLDRAVRRYAKMVEAGDPIADVTYHEGYRVKRLTIAGNDISEYAIVRVCADDRCVSTAADTLASYIERTCGAKLAVCTEEDFSASGAAHKIAISSGVESLGDEGYTISVGEDGTLAIEGGVWRGSLWGVYDLLEDDVGWRFIGSKDYGYTFVPMEKREYLYEAEHIDLTAAINRTETPSIPIRLARTSLGQKDDYLALGNAARGGFGFPSIACHGLQSYHTMIFSGEYEGLYKGLYEEWRQPCFTNDDILEAIDNYALTFVRQRLDAGQQIGRELIAVDVAQWDGMWYTFCDCKNCLAVERVEGCHTGPYLQMANRVCALLDENYPGMCASILAYCGTDQLPAVTRPAHNLFVAYCFYFSSDYMSCQNHCISGVDCTWSNQLNNHNKTAARRFEEWLAVMDPSMIQIWYYPLNDTNHCYNAPMYLTILEDVKYLADAGVGQIFACTGGEVNLGHINEELTKYLFAKYTWDASITKEGSLDLIREWFELIYGDAGDLLYELTMLAEFAGDRAGCWCGFWNGSNDHVDYGFISEHAEEIWETCDLALSLAGDSEEYELIEKYAAGFRFLAVLSRYDDMYVNGTPQEHDFLAAKYTEVWETFLKYKLYEDFLTHLPKLPETVDTDVHPRDWITGKVAEKTG